MTCIIYIPILRSESLRLICIWKDESPKKMDTGRKKQLLAFLTAPHPRKRTRAPSKEGNVSVRESPILIYFN